MKECVCYFVYIGREIASPLGDELSSGGQASPRSYESGFPRSPISKLSYVAGIEKCILNVGCFPTLFRLKTNSLSNYSQL